MSKEIIITAIEKAKDDLFSIAGKIWNYAELSHEEKESSALQKKYLREAGFRITELDDIQKYAFIAEWGSGFPVVGLMGEFDALPGLSQKVQTTKEAVVLGGPGHGCGHNLLGTALLGAALAVKAAIDAGQISGTIRYFGTPAEEQLGKPILAKAGVFAGLDSVFGYHPADLNTVAAFGTNASLTLSIDFHGVSSHAAQVPHLGRSALDALTLTQVGMEFLREHVPATARMHNITKYGGERANIVPDFASGDFQIRAPSMGELISLLKRLLDVAEGAALMTSTKSEYKIHQGCYNFIPNKVLSDLLYENLMTIDPPYYSKEELDYCQKLSDTMTTEQKRNSLLNCGVDAAMIETLLPSAIHNGRGYWGQGFTIPASTDVGDVSHLFPTAQIYTATYPLGIGSHTWQATSASGSKVGMKGMIYAAKIFGSACFDLFSRPEIIKSAKSEWEKTTAGEKYVAAVDLLNQITRSKTN